MTIPFLPSTKQFFLDNFTTYYDTKDIWQAAGGKPALILDQATTQVRWTDLLTKAQSGAIEPIKLILQALQQYKFSPVLLLELKNQTLSEDQAIASQFLDTPENQNYLMQLNHIPPDRAAAAVTVEIIDRALHDKPLNQSSDVETIRGKFVEKIAELAITPLFALSTTGWLDILHLLNN